MKYSFNHARDAWYCGKKPVDEEEVLIYLIKYAKSQNIQNAGEYAVDALVKAKAAPELTTSAFVKNCMVKNRNPGRPANTYSRIGRARHGKIDLC